MLDKKINCILVLTYNQEEYIQNCLESILCQKEYINEIIVQDDCSTDSTWMILCQYKEKYPELFKIYQNKKNLGVFGNYNSILDKASGKIVSLVAGDDGLCPDILSKFYELYMLNNLNCDESFIIYTKSIMFNETECIEFDNISYKQNPIEATLKCEGGLWDIGLSIALVKKMPRILENIGYQADWLQHFERVMSCSKYFYIDSFGYKYRMGAGVTVKEKQEKQIQSKEIVKKIFKEKYSKYLTKEIINQFDVETNFSNYIMNPTAKNYFNMLLGRIKIGFFYHDKYHDKFTLYIPIQLKQIIKRIIGKSEK